MDNLVIATPNAIHLVLVDQEVAQVQDHLQKVRPSILNRTRVISSPYIQRAACCSVGEKLKEKMGHKLMFGSHFSYEYGQL